MSVDEGAGPNGLKVDAAQAERLHKFAHDLKNRLNGMGTSLRMLHELPEGPERNEVRDYAERAYFKALFDLETVFLFIWALGAQPLTSFMLATFGIFIFLLVLILLYVYRMRLLEAVRE